MSTSSIRSVRSNDSAGTPGKIHQNILRHREEGDVFDKYEVTEVLGEGSMGAVCKARILPKKVGGSAFYPKKTRRGPFGGLFKFGKRKTKAGTGLSDDDISQEHLYALKSIQLARVSPSFFKELENEIDILRRLDHPNIVRAYEVYSSPQQIYLVLELCDGGDLYSRSPYTEREAGKITGMCW